MTSPLPTSPALTAMVSDLLRMVPPTYWAAMSRQIEAIRREQDHATLESIDRASVTRPAPGGPVVFDLDSFRRARCEAHDPTDPEAA
jgi:hypothetical protein